MCIQQRQIFRDGSAKVFGYDFRTHRAFGFGVFIARVCNVCYGGFFAEQAGGIAAGWFGWGFFRETVHANSMLNLPVKVKHEKYAYSCFLAVVC
jgi:hypothetical protein